MSDDTNNSGPTDESPQAIPDPPGPSDIDVLLAGFKAVTDATDATPKVLFFGQKTFGHGSPLGNTPSEQPQPVAPPVVNAAPPSEPILSRRQLAERRLAAIRKRRQDAYDLRADGYGYREIGYRLGVSHMTARTYVRAIEAEERESAAKTRMRLGARSWHSIRVAHEELERERAKAQPNGEIVSMLLTAIDRSSDRIAKLEGSYAPTKIASTTPDGKSWAPVTAFLSRLSDEEVLLGRKLAAMRVVPELSDGQKIGGDVLDAEVIDGAATR